MALARDYVQNTWCCPLKKRLKLHIIYILLACILPKIIFPSVQEQTLREFLP